MSAQLLSPIADAKDQKAQGGFEAAAVSSVSMARTLQTDVPSFARLAVQTAMKPE